MSNTLGKLFKVSLFGESHGQQVGCVIDGIPPGMKLDMGLIELRLMQRKSSDSSVTTSRQEPDHFKIASGWFKGKTTGSPLCVYFENSQAESSDYEILKKVYRPGHADYTGAIKYQGANDYRGGGHFSARLTTALVFAGAVAEQCLRDLEIDIQVQLQAVGAEKSKSIQEMSKVERLETQSTQYAIHASYVDNILEVIRSAQKASDSVGGLVEILVEGIPAGIGEPYFDTVEGELAKAIFSIPGVKGIEFGAGYSLLTLKGSEANDPYILDASGEVGTRTNHNGGINGGITNGMPLYFNCIFKPTASIGKEQETLDFETMEPTRLRVQGRHDPCIALRAPAVVRAMTALVIYDLILVNRGLYGK